MMWEWLINLHVIFCVVFISPCQSVKQLSNLISSLDILEPHSPELLYRMSLAFTRAVR